MLTQDIKSKIKELFENKSKSVIGISFGNKVTGGKSTGNRSIVFSVNEKLPLEKIPPGELIPSNIDINGVSYLTDVIQIGKVRAITCDPSCYTWQTDAPSNRNMIRPIQAGSSIGSQNTAVYVDDTLYEWFVGTMGLIAVDVNSNSLVGVTNNHVLIQDGFSTTDINLNGVIESEQFNTVYQDGETGPDSTKAIGQVLRYYPLSLSEYNQSDVAVFSLNPAFISMTYSYYIYGLTGQPGAIPFASTDDINNLLTTNPSVYSSGRTTGVKEGICQLAISSIGVSIDVDGYQLQGNTQSITFSDIIHFTRQDPTCSDPIYSGDSGSALIADFGGGVWKIIGLCFSGDDSYNGYACRIDDIASQISITAWDGSIYLNIVDPTSISYITVDGATDSQFISYNGQNYWQIGLTTSTINYETAQPVQYTLFNQSSNNIVLETIDVYNNIRSYNTILSNSSGTTSCLYITDSLQAYGGGGGIIDVYSVSSGLGNLVLPEFTLNYTTFKGKSDFIITDTGVPVAYYEYDLYNQSSNSIGLRTIDGLTYNIISTQSDVASGYSGSMYSIYPTYSMQSYGLTNGQYVDVYSFYNGSTNLLSSNYLVEVGTTITTGGSAIITNAGVTISYPLTQVLFATGSYYISTNYSPSSSWGNITFPDFANNISVLDPNLIGLTGGTTSVQLYINESSITGDNSTLLNQLVGNTATLTLLQGLNYVTYLSTDQAFFNVEVSATVSVIFYDETSGSATGSLTVLTPSTEDFNTIDPITIAIYLL